MSWFSFSYTYIHTYKQSLGDKKDECSEEFTPVLHGTQWIGENVEQQWDYWELSHQKHERSSSICASIVSEPVNAVPTDVKVLQTLFLKSTISSLSFSLFKPLFVCWCHNNYISTSDVIAFILPHRLISQKGIVVVLSLKFSRWMQSQTLCWHSNRVLK